MGLLATPADEAGLVGGEEGIDKREQGSQVDGGVYGALGVTSFGLTLILSVTVGGSTGQVLVLARGGSLYYGRWSGGQRYRARKERTHYREAFVYILSALNPRYSGTIPEGGSNLVDGAMGTVSQRLNGGV
ncbi:hypothetical protein PGTUg99_013479 [Puccinia graminis f. sp. tritici]|uniref:Uncharacterized protein n=1 Tax=Puccinia graminis f. sp. tritici TaxID=56615 RepID=A0A5B0Q0V0_PUCGR|nr:hypothetical protein PGTUg99_013479 [Puccinia graminis f. sp. tritici]